MQLQRLLGDSYKVKNFGCSGTTVLTNGSKPYRNTLAYQNALFFQPEIVIIKLGTNDSTSKNWQHADQFVNDYIDLIQSFQKLNTCPSVYICYPTPAFTNSKGITEKTLREEIVPLIDQIAARTGAQIIDLYTPLKDRPELLPDAVHPNAKGASVIADTIAKSLQPQKPLAMTATSHQ